MAAKVGATAQELGKEAERIRTRLGAIGAEVTGTSDLDRLQALAIERGTLEQGLQALDQRITAAQAEAAQAEAERREAERAAELATVTKELDNIIPTIRDLTERLGAALDAYGPLAQRYIHLGGASWTRPSVGSALGQVVKAQRQSWRQWDRLPEERKEREAQARKARLAELERIDRLQEERAKEAERLRERYPWAVQPESAETPATG